jgi:hypothetical protein
MRRGCKAQCQKKEGIAMSFKSVLLVSTSGCTPKKQITLQTRKGRVTFKGLVSKMKRWFKKNPSMGKYRSLLWAKEAREIFRNLRIYTEIGKADLVALFSEKE